MTERVPGILTALSGLGVFVAVTSQSGALFHIVAFGVVAAVVLALGVARD